MGLTKTRHRLGMLILAGVLLLALICGSLCAAWLVDAHAEKTEVQKPRRMMEAGIVYQGQGWQFEERRIMLRHEPKVTGVFYKNCGRGNGRVSLLTRDNMLQIRKVENGEWPNGCFVGWQITDLLENGVVLKKGTERAVVQGQRLILGRR